MPLSHKESIGLYPAPADDKEVIIGRDGKGGFHLIRRLVCRLSAGQALPLEGKPFGRGDGGFKATQKGEISYRKVKRKRP